MSDTPPKESDQSRNQFLRPPIYDVEEEEIEMDVLPDLVPPKRYLTTQRGEKSPLRSLTTTSGSPLHRKQTLAYHRRTPSVASAASHNAAPKNRFARMIRTTSAASLTASTEKERKQHALLEALKVSAEEVKQTKTFERRFLPFLPGFTSYNSVRETYRLIKEEQRDTSKNTWSYFVNLPFVMTRKLYSSMRKFFRSNRRVVIFSILDMCVDITFCLLYLVEIQINFDQHHLSNHPAIPYWLQVYRPDWLFKMALTFSCWNFGAFVVRLTYATDKFSAFFRLNSLLDIGICVPFIVLSRIPYGYYYYVPYFLRCFVALERMSGVIRMRGNWEVINFDVAFERLIILISYILTLIYFSLCAFNYSEYYYGQNTQNLSLMQTFYFIIITISTVGYGDITPQTVPGQIVVIFTILLAISFLPGLIAATVETIQSRQAGGGSVRVRKKAPFILVCGKFETPSQLVDVINEFFWREKSTATATRIVFFSPVKATPSIKAIVNQSVYQDLITFIFGSPLNEADMDRVKLHEAVAAFLIPDRGASDYQEESDRITLRSLAFDNFAPETPLYVYNLLPETYALQEKIATISVCLDSLKQMLLGYNCICRGTGTILINLLRQTSTRDTYDEPWEAQYGDGVGNKIFADKVNPVFYGYKFASIACYVYEQFQVILFGISFDVDQRKHLFLNPGHRYVFKEHDEYFLIAPRFQDVKAIHKLTKERFDASYHHDMRENVREYNVTPHSRSASVAKSQLLLKLPEITTRSSTQLPLCYLLKDLPPLEELVIVDASDWTSHILVCTRSFNLFEFMAVLRSASLAPEEYKQVVFLSRSLPSENEVEDLLQFPGVFFMEGDPRKRKDLIRAGIQGCNKVVIMNLGNSISDSDDPEYSDTNTIMVSHLIHSMFHGPHKKYVINELFEKENIKFLRPTALKHYNLRVSSDGSHINTSRRAFTEDSFTYTPVFASGRVVASSMMGSILYQSYYNPMIVRIFRQFCGFRREEEVNLEERMNLNTPHLCYISVPDEFVGLTFGSLFKDLMCKFGILAIGLFREEINTALGNRLPFVYTNPLSSALLRATDRVYVLASNEQLDSGKGVF